MNTERRLKQLTKRSLELFYSRDTEIEIAIVNTPAYDLEMFCFAYHLSFGGSYFPKSLADLEADKTLRYYSIAIDVILQMMNESTLALIKRRDPIEVRKNALLAFANSEQPLVRGTIAELAARYGISKSAVRKMRATDQNSRGKQE